MKMYKYKCRILRHDEIVKKKCIYTIYSYEHEIRHNIVLYVQYRLHKEGMLEREGEGENDKKLVRWSAATVYACIGHFFYATIARGWIIFVYWYVMYAKTVVCKNNPPQQ